MYSVPLYNSLDEAVRVFPEYAGCPTLINLYNALITQISAKYEVPGKDFPPVFTTSLDISKVTSERYMKVLKQIAKGHLRKNFLLLFYLLLPKRGYCSDSFLQIDALPRSLSADIA